MANQSALSYYDTLKIDEIFSQHGWPKDAVNKSSLYKRFIRTYEQLSVDERDSSLAWMSTLCIVSPEGIFISSRFAGGHLHPMAGLQRIKCSSAAFSSACRHRLRQHRIWLSAIPFPLAYSSGFIHTQICCLSFSVSLFSGISPSLGLMYSRRYPS